jgi:hypothetical protein
MSLPKVVILYANGNLLQDIAAIDSIAAIVGTGSTADLLGVPKTVFNLEDAVSKGFTEQAEPDMYRHLKEFYGELGGNQELHIMLVANTMTLAQMVDTTNQNGAVKLIRAAQSRVRLLGVYRKPPAGYDGGDDFIDADVQAAILTGKVFGQTRLGELSPIRILIEGRVQHPAADNTLQPSQSANGYSGVVLGGTLNDGSASVGLALGRAVKFSAEIKIGKVANGPLSVSGPIYIGDKELKDVLNLSTLHGAGFISFMQHPQKAGYYFGIDRMASTDDFRRLAYGRILDKAAIIAAATYVEELEGEANIDDDGNIDTLELAHLESAIVQQINARMGSQISGVNVYINPAQNLIETETLRIKLRVRPKGYKSFIEIDLGLTATT